MPYQFRKKEHFIKKNLNILFSAARSIQNYMPDRIVELNIKTLITNIALSPLKVQLL